MLDYQTTWDINLRANLRLWPQPVPNIEALVRLTGSVYDETALLQDFPDQPGKAPTDARAVRNTFEILAYAGLMYRDGDPQRLLLTPLGECVFSFLGTIGSQCFVNDANRALLARVMIPGLSLQVETRAIWMIMRRTDNRLCNEELNRAMAGILRLADVDGIVDRITEARRTADPSKIGARIYRPNEFGTSKETEQRKAMNPHFLLAGGGGLFISVEGDEDMRRIEDGAVPFIDQSLAAAVPLVHASTQKETILRISNHATPPLDVRGLS